MATTIAVVGALAGAAGSYYGAKESNKPKKSWTDQTTEQTPYMGGAITPDLEQVLAHQRGIAQQGIPRLGPNGNLYYESLPTGAAPGSSATGAGAGSAPPVPPGGSRRPDGRILDARGKTIYTPPSPATGAPRPRGGGAGKGSGAPILPPRPGSGSPSAGPDLSSPEGIFSEVARRGLDAGGTSTIAGARNAMNNIWGAAGGAGSAAAGERTGFEGYNPILDRLTGTLESDVEDRVGRDLMLGFLGESGRAGTSGGGAGTGAGSRGGGFGGRFITQGSGGGALGSSPGAGGGGGVPDTMATPSFFGTETRRLFDEPANEAELQTLIDAMNADVEKGMFRDLAQLDAAAQGAGRLGGDSWKAMSRDAREEALAEMLESGARVRVGDREARRNARLQGLGLVNQRDLGLLSADVSREGIRASGASNADSLALARRAQDLSAIGSLLDNERFSLGELGEVGGQLSGDRLASLGMVPGLEGIGLSGLQTTLGAGGGMVDIRGQDTQRAIAGQQANIARQGLNQQRGIFNAQQGQAAVNDYLRTLLSIGGMGGTSHTAGQNVQPGLGVSPTGAAAMGALGGAATGAGLYQTYRGY